MPLGYVCHVFSTRNKKSAEAVIKAMGKAFRIIREATAADNRSVSGRSLESGDSVISHTSGSMASRSSRRSAPHAAGSLSLDSFADSCVTPSPVSLDHRTKVKKEKKRGGGEEKKEGRKEEQEKRSLKKEGEGGTKRKRTSPFHSALLDFMRLLHLPHATPPPSPQTTTRRRRIRAPSRASLAVRGPPRVRVRSGR